MNTPRQAFAYVAFLLLSTARVSSSQTPAAPRAVGSITIRSNDRQTVLSPTDLASIARRSYRVAAEGSTDSATVSGVTLWDILQKSGIPSAEASGRQRAAMYVQLTGADGQTAVIALVEIDPSFSRRSVIVVDRRNGQPLDAVEGPWRAIVSDDLRHARWIRGLSTIDIKTVTP
ncbi:MAG TPA: molybdopterin-dependent oxidoreductase [Gemmatimonadaceae bacterium]|nr:molybdopterin-dependent oxidoreductase [Gemmatimonadaceae bacterium]